MKKFTIIFSTILLLSVAVSAQITSDSSTEWKTLSPENEEFSVDAPKDIERFCNDDKCINNKYSWKSVGTYIFIFTNDLKSGFDETPMKFIEVNQKAELEKQTNQDEMKFAFSDDEEFFHTIYTKKTKTRTYFFHLVSGKKDDPNVLRFFKSLKIKPGSEAGETDKESVEDIAKAENPEQQKPVSGTGSGRGSGVGNGIGTGQGGGFSTSSQNSETKVLENKPLQITFKPKPRYNDFARYYGITGNVRMRMTFLKNGAIGETIPLTKLPFSLTKSATEAAKQMRFEPMIENSQTISTTKVVVFNFTIY